MCVRARGNSTRLRDDARDFWLPQNGACGCSRDEPALPGGPRAVAQPLLAFADSSHSRAAWSSSGIKRLREVPDALTFYRNFVAPSVPVVIPSSATVTTRSLVPAPQGAAL